MKSEAAAKLDRLLRLRRIKRGAIPLLLVLSLAFALAWLVKEDPVVSERSLAGTVTGWSRAQTEDGVGKLIISVTLETGDKISFSQRTPLSPTKGAEIQVLKRQKESGRVTYQWIPAPPETDQ